MRLYLSSNRFGADPSALTGFIGKEYRAALENYDILWIFGGNAFLLRMVMILNGLDTVLEERLKHDSISYAGYSAAGCVLSPSLEAFTEVDDSSLPEAVYGQSADISGPGVLEYCFVPHFGSDYSASAAVKNTAEKLEMKCQPYRGLHDGEVLIVNDSKERVMS